MGFYRIQVGKFERSWKSYLLHQSSGTHILHSHNSLGIYSMRPCIAKPSSIRNSVDDVFLFSIRAQIKQLNYCINMHTNGRTADDKRENSLFAYKKKSIHLMGWPFDVNSSNSMGITASIMSLSFLLTCSRIAQQNNFILPILFVCAPLFPSSNWFLDSPFVVRVSLFAAALM